MPYLSATVSKDKAEKVALDVLSHFFKEMQEKTKVVEDEEDGEDLCDCEFSLAYGMLLNPFFCFLLVFWSFDCAPFWASSFASIVAP